MQRLPAWLPSVLAALLLAGMGALFAYWQAVHDQSDRARILSGVVLKRADQTSDQMAAAFKRLAVFGPNGACSDAGLTEMRRIDLGSSLLQGVGLVRGTTLVCSSLDGDTQYDIGQPDVISSFGNALRTQRVLPMAPETPILILTSPEGYTAFIHPALIFVLSDEGDNAPAGIVGYSTREPLLWSVPLDVDWKQVQLDPKARAGIFESDGHLVAWTRSEVRDTISYATVRVAGIWSEFERILPPYAAIGAVLGLLAGYLVRRLSVSRASLPTLLKAGIARGEILLMYQPIVDLVTGEWVGAEALARWRRRSGEWVPPDTFIPIAERHGLIGAITKIVTRKAIADFAELTRRGLFISINISPTDLRRSDCAESLHQICLDERVAPKNVHLELTEREDANEPVTTQAVAQLRDDGFKVGLDDFGIGYSNLAYLDALPVDYIKIDRAFAGSAGRRGPGGEILDHIIDLAAARRLEVIAEGVETEEQRAGLIERGVRLGQGWLFGRPMTLADFVTTRPAAVIQRPSLVTTDVAA